MLIRRLWSWNKHQYGELKFITSESQGGDSYSAVHCAREMPEQWKSLLHRRKTVPSSIENWRSGRWYFILRTCDSEWFLCSNQWSLTRMVVLTTVWSKKHGKRPINTLMINCVSLTEKFICRVWFFSANIRMDLWLLLVTDKPQVTVGVCVRFRLSACGWCPPRSVRWSCVNMSMWWSV